MVVCYGIGISSFVEGVHVCLQGVMVIGWVPKPWGRWLGCVWVILYDLDVLCILSQPLGYRRWYTRDFPQGQLFWWRSSNVRVGCDWPSSKSVIIFTAYNSACVGLDFVIMNDQFNQMVDCFGNGLEEDISLDVVAVTIWVWEQILYLVQRHTAHMDRRSKIGKAFQWGSGGWEAWTCTHRQYCSDIFEGCVLCRVWFDWFLLWTWWHASLVFSRLLWCADFYSMAVQWVFLYGSCIWCLLLLVKWCGGFCGA